MKAAMEERNPKAIAAFFTPDFVSIDVSGKSQNASEIIQELAGLPKVPPSASTTTLLSVKIVGNCAIVNQRYEMNTFRVATDGSEEHGRLVMLSTDTWVNATGVWLVQKTVTTQLDYFKNGQLVTHKTNPPRR